MEVKLFEVRDRATFVPVMAVRLTHRDAVEKFLLHRAGYAPEQTTQYSSEQPYIIYWPLIGGIATYDAYGHDTRARTHPVAHLHMIENWNKLDSGMVIDVEFILGETPQPKTSERSHG